VTARPAPPPRSSRRLHWRRAEFAALDFETTGLDLRRDAVVSFGLVPVRQGRIDLSEAIYQEVAPEVPPSHRSITIHHLRPIDLVDAPALGDVIQRLRASLEGRYLLAWSAEIEAAFLARAFGGRVHKWLARTVDVLSLAMLADRLEGRDVGGSSYALGEAVVRAGLPVEEAHDALNDALMTAEMFLVLATRLESFGFQDVRSLTRPTHPDHIRSALPMPPEARSAG
jgi:DNA polymerase III subunit epsilon